MSTVDKAGYVYALVCLDEIKLGRAKKSVEQRRKAVQTGRGSPVTIKYRLYVKDMCKAERFLHNAFIGYHIGGEWFKFDDKGMGLLTSIFEQTLDHAQLTRVGLRHYDI